MIKKMRAARSQRADDKAPAVSNPPPEAQWSTEPEPSAEQDAVRADETERRRRLDFLYRLINGVG